jgi:hypothetical protein
MSHCRQGAKTMGNIPTQMQRTRWQAPLPQSRCRSGVAPPRPSAVTAQAHRKSTADLAASALAKHTRRATRHGEADDEARPMDSETMKKGGRGEPGVLPSATVRKRTGRRKEGMGDLFIHAALRVASQSSPQPPGDAEPRASSTPAAV